MNRTTPVSLSIAAIGFLLGACSETATPVTSGDAPAAASQSETTLIKLTEENFSEAETAKNFRNWAARGANEGIAHMRQLPPRGDAAPTIQMNDDTLYSVVITEAQDGKVTFTIPPSDVYLAVQVVNEGGHGEHYVVEDGTHTVDVASRHAFLIYRTGLEKGMEHAFAVQETIPDDTFVFGTYETRPFDYDEVQEWVERYRDETRDYVLEYTFPRSAAEITDLHQWNLENANGWGGASPVVDVSNKYSNSVFMDGDTCYTTTFEDPKSVYFTSVTAYDYGRYLMEGVENVNSYSWTPNDDGTITISFNCGDEAINNIDTKGERLSFTMRYYGVTQAVIDGEIAPEKSVVEAAM
jgi:hypothetical protein